MGETYPFAVNLEVRCNRASVATIFYVFPISIFFVTWIPQVIPIRRKALLAVKVNAEVMQVFATKKEPGRLAPGPVSLETRVTE